VKRFAWPLALPPMLCGMLAAHALAYRLTVPESLRAPTLAATGHGWLTYLPLVLATAACVLVLGVVRRIAQRDRTQPAAWPFAFFPPLALLLQEQLERGGLAFDATIAAGVLLAIPLGLLAYAVLRALLGVADSLVVSVRAPRLALPQLVVLLPVALPPARPATVRAARGPPRRVR
jgi:hypothetical protein